MYIIILYIMYMPSVCFRILKDNAIDQLYPGNLTYYPDLDYLDLSNNLIEVFPANLESTAVPINDL